MPVRNAAPWIEETITSIIDQSYKEWELICIDDYSTDSSLNIISSNSDNRIKLVKNSQIGIIPALQLGLSIASGKYITRMDADDIMPEYRLEKMEKVIRNSLPRTIVTGRVEYISDSKISDGYKKYENWLNDRILQNDHWKQIYRECVIASPNWLTRKKDILENRIFDDLQYPEDYDMVFRWYEKGFRVEPINKTTLLWREHPERTSRNSEIYDQASFFQLKLNWFIKLVQPKDAGIAVFGAGKKGKIASDFLEKQNVPFTVYDVDHRKYGNDVENPEEAKEPIALICVYPDNLNSVVSFLERKGYHLGKNAWFV